MEKREKIYEGKAKQLFTTDNPDLLVQYFKDEATAFDGKKKGIIEEKGVLNNKISSRIFEMLEEKGVKTHFVERLSDREMLVKKLRIIPVEVVIRNVAAGSLCKRLGIEEGMTLKEPTLEFFYKSDPLGDPMINEYIARAFGWATDAELGQMKEAAFRINSILSEFFSVRGIILVDFKLEFGEHKGEVLLGGRDNP